MSLNARKQNCVIRGSVKTSDNLQRVAAIILLPPSFYRSKRI